MGEQVAQDSHDNLKGAERWASQEGEVGGGCILFGVAVGRQHSSKSSKIKSERSCEHQRAAGQCDAFMKFIQSCPQGTFEEYVDFLLMGGGVTENGGGEEYNSILHENFYHEESEYRKLWNDNLTMGLPESTLEGRSFVPPSGADGRHLSSGTQRPRTFSAEVLRGRAFSEGERLKKHIAQVDRQRIKQGLGSAVNALSNVSSFALKPLRDMQTAEQIHAKSVDAEERGARREIQEQRDLAEMMKMKREAEESCLNATVEHLVGFIQEHPRATYHQWIEEFHPENAHDGALLEGLGKTIDHRFFVEESDHRRMWNDHLLTFLEPNSSEGRDFVPASKNQVEAADILTGSPVSAAGATPQNHRGTEKSCLDGVDLITFD